MKASGEMEPSRLKSHEALKPAYTHFGTKKRACMRIGISIDGFTSRTSTSSRRLHRHRALRPRMAPASDNM